MNPVAKKLSLYVEEGLLSKNFIFGDAPKVETLWRAIAEIQRLEGLLLEERMKLKALKIEIKKRYRPLSGKQVASQECVDDILKTMGIK